MLKKTLSYAKQKNVLAKVNDEETLKSENKAVFEEETLSHDDSNHDYDEETLTHNKESYVSDDEILEKVEEIEKMETMMKVSLI